MDDKCPWCGAALEPENASTEVMRWYECDTRSSEMRSSICYERQIARMQPVVDALGKYLHGRNRRTGVDQEWCDMSWERVSDEYGRYMGGE